MRVGPGKPAPVGLGQSSQTAFAGQHCLHLASLFARTAASRPGASSFTVEMPSKRKAMPSGAGTALPLTLGHESSVGRCSSHARQPVSTQSADDSCVGFPGMLDGFPKKFGMTHNIKRAPQARASDRVGNQADSEAIWEKTIHR